MPFLCCVHETVLERCRSLIRSGLATGINGSIIICSIPRQKIKFDLDCSYMLVSDSVCISGVSKPDIHTMYMLICTCLLIFPCDTSASLRFITCVRHCFRLPAQHQSASADTPCWLRQQCSNILLAPLEYIAMGRSLKKQHLHFMATKEKLRLYGSIVNSSATVSASSHSVRRKS